VTRRVLVALPHPEVSFMLTAPRLALLAAPVLALFAAVAPSPRAHAGEGRGAPTLPEARALEARLATLAQEATPKTVCVFGVIGLGTGAVVDAKGTVVTNAHVAAGARWAVVLSSDGTRRLYKRRGIDFEKDLAVLEPEEALTAPSPHFRLETIRPEAGTDLAALGYPGGPRGASPLPTFTYGRAVTGAGNMSVMGMLDYQDAIRTDVPTFSGNSGGPLVNMQGDLVGLNGAVDLSGEGNGLAVPAALVQDRLRTLQGGVILLPGGMKLDPRTNPLVRRLEDALDPIVKRMAGGNMGAPREGPPGGEGTPTTAQGDPEAAGAFLARAATSGRNKDLSALFDGARPSPIVLRGVAPHAFAGVVATGLADGTHVVALSGAVPPDVVECRDGEDRPFTVVARDEALGLVLLRARGHSLGSGRISETVEPGRLIAVLDGRGRAFAGVVSAPARRISESNARALAASAGESPITKAILEGVKQVARLLDSKEVLALVEQLEAAQKMQRGFAAASTARGFSEVISHDAPVPPRLAGATLVDLEGRVVGVHVANAHFGTSYAVSIASIRRAFAAHLGDAPAPALDRRRDPGTGAPERPRTEAPRRAPAAPGKREPKLF